MIESGATLSIESMTAAVQIMAAADIRSTHKTFRGPISGLYSTVRLGSAEHMVLAAEMRLNEPSDWWRM